MKIFFVEKPTVPVYESRLSEHVLSSGHSGSRADADDLFQETTDPKGIPLCCAFSIQTTKAGCGEHTLVKRAKIVSAGCLADCRQREESAEQKPAEGWRVQGGNAQGLTGVFSDGTFVHI